MTIDIPDEAVAYEWKYYVRIHPCINCGEPMYTERGHKFNGERCTEWATTNMEVGGRRYHHCHSIPKESKP
jgi:hypothetical protein